MKRIILLLGFNLLLATLYAQKSQPISQHATTVLYRKSLNDKDKYPELLLNGVACNFTAQGLVVTGNQNIIRLNKYYSLGERLVRYHVRFSGDTKAVFQSNTGDFKVIIDVPKQTASVETKPAVWKRVKINAANEYLVEIQRIYQQSKVIITDLSTGEEQELEINGDGMGGVGEGATGSESGIVHQWDYYCFGLLEGGALTVKQICVQSMEQDLTLLIYGDSITQPEGYFPAKDFPLSWTQLIMQHVKGRSMSSGRGGCTIKEVLERIKNELPYIKAKYVMVTIGTNGGNTEQNLSELVEYIKANGAIPILNNIPSNEHGTQVEVNRLIEKVRTKYGINGCLFDIATSLNRNGKEVDKATMWFEDYTAINNWGHYYHHPNVKGSRLMYIQTLIDIPEIYE
ncbi:MAG: SGNH/GDSL hydrolase family protein [Chitinophagaceae bacterium]|nr:SGNH/GDSL hydrolase family protein [Chitinophagaceae bacterium]